MDDVRLTVLDQLDQLEEVVLEGSRLPFTGGRLVNEGDAVEVLDAVREALPKEIERAAKLIERRDDFINTARQQAEERTPFIIAQFLSHRAGEKRDQ